MEAHKIIYKSTTEFLKFVNEREKKFKKYNSLRFNTDRNISKEIKKENIIIAQ